MASGSGSFLEQTLEEKLFANSMITANGYYQQRPHISSNNINRSYVMFSKFFEHHLVLNNRTKEKEKVSFRVPFHVTPKGLKRAPLCYTTERLKEGATCATNIHTTTKLSRAQERAPLPYPTRISSKKLNFQKITYHLMDR